MPNVNLGLYNIIQRKKRKKIKTDQLLKELKKMQSINETFSENSASITKIIDMQ